MDLFRSELGYALSEVEGKHNPDELRKILEEEKTRFFCYEKDGFFFCKNCEKRYTEEKDAIECCLEGKRAGLKNSMHKKYEDNQQKTEILEEYQLKKDKLKPEVLKASGVIYEDDNGKERINCPSLARLILFDDDNDYVVIEDNQQILWYNGSYYEPIGERIIEQRTNYYLGNRMCSKYKTEVLTFIKTYGYINIKRETLEPPVNLINLKNGILNIETKELLPHNPEYKFLNEIPVIYNPAAKIDKIKIFLENTLDINDIPIMQEFFGDCLQRSYSYKRAIMCVGERDTGKSQLLNLLDLFLGKENTSNVSLYELCTDRFASIELYGKLANLCAELDPQEISHIDRFLSLTGGDWQSGQKKFQDRFKFKSYAKLIFSCNKIPDAKNKNEAFYVRWIVIVFSNQIPFEEQIEDYYKTITTEEELSGLLNWALEGLDRLKEKHGYSEHKSLEEVKDLMQKGSNPIREFVDQYIIVDPTGEIEKQELYLSYVEFCKNLKYPYKADNVFSRMFKPELPHGTVLSEGQRKSDGKRIWKGIVCKYERIGDVITLDTYDNVYHDKTDKQQRGKNEKR